MTDLRDLEVALTSNYCRRVHREGSMAVVTGEYSQVGTNDGKDNTSAGVYTNTWVKRKGRWLVIQSVFP